MNQSDKASTRRRRSSYLQNLNDTEQDNEIIASSLQRPSGRSRRRRITSTDCSPDTEENNQDQKKDEKDDVPVSIRPRRSTRNCNNNSSDSRPQSMNNMKKKRKMATATMESSKASKKKHTMTSRSNTTALSISTTTSDQCTTRFSSKSTTKKRMKSVTPSPIASSTTETSFGFTSPIQPATKQTSRRKSSINDDKRSLPSGVVDLYPDDDSTTTSVESNEHRRNQPKVNRSLSLTSCCKYRGRSTMFSDTSNEFLTVEFIRTYGEEYWNALRKSEKPIIYDPSMSDNAKNLSSPNKRRNSNRCGIQFGSPYSSSSSSSTSLSMSSTMSKVTPNKKQNDFLFNEDWNKDNNSYQPCESTALMSVQPQLTPKMRSILIDWLIELSEHFSFDTSTLHLAITMVDRVLASGKSLEAGNEERRRLPSVSFHPLSSSTKDSHNSCYDSDSNTDEEDDNNDNYGDDDDDDDDDDEGSKDTLCYHIPRDRFQLLGATCVWLSCKVQEISPPKAKEIAYVSDHIYTIQQIKTMERRVCNALDFTFFEAPTPHQFLFEFIRASFAQEAASSCTNIIPGTCSCSDRRCVVPAAVTGVGSAIDSVFRDMAHYLLELGRLPFGPTGQKPSLLAAAVVYLTRVTLGIPRTATSRLSSSLSGPDYDPYWTPTLEHYTGYSKCDIFETVLDIHAYHMAAETSNLKAVFNKYKSKKFHRVALKTVVLKEDLGF
mmetsp:Transcript_53338/g.59643  ORF Transcript_53338/g.59643 Transcript_53338/m.59643 type:complete len:717 (+) Transcript_53338:110-2260(+)